MAERARNEKNEELIIIHPNELRPARRTTKPEAAAAEPTSKPREPSPAEPAGLPDEQKRLQEELRSIRRQLTAERQAIVAQKSMLEKEYLQREAGTLKAVELEREQLQGLRAELQTMREQLAAERNTLETERSRLAAESRSLQTDRTNLQGQGEQLAAESLAAGRQKEQFDRSRQQLADQQREIERDREQLDRQSAEQGHQAEELSADRESVDQQHGEVARRREELDRRGQQLQDQQNEAEARAGQLASLQEKLNRRTDDLAAEQDKVNQRARQLAEQASRHAEHVARFDETVASVRTAQAMADQEEKDLAEPAEAKEIAAAAATEQTVEPPAAEFSPDLPWETASATDQDLQTLLSELHGEPHTDDPAEVAPTSPASLSPRPRRSRMTTWLLLSAGLAVVLIGGGVALVPVLKEFMNGSGRATSGGPDIASTAQPAEPSNPEVKARPAPDPEPEATAEPAADTVAEPPPKPTPEPVAEPAAGPPTEDEGQDEPQEPAQAEDVAATDTATEAASEPVAGPADESPSDPLLQDGRQVAVVSEPAAQTALVPGIEAEPKVEPAPEAEPEIARKEPDLPLIPGGIWPYSIPENLAPSQDLQPTLVWARKELVLQISAVRKAYSFGPQNGPRQAIAIGLDEKLQKELQRFSPLPYLPEKVRGPDGADRPETVQTVIFLEFLHQGRQYLYMLKRREGDGSIVPGRKGSFVLIPGAVQEHTVVLDPQGRTIPEPID